MLPIQALLLMCHLDNDLVIIIYMYPAGLHNTPGSARVVGLILFVLFCFVCLKTRCIIAWGGGGGVPTALPATATGVPSEYNSIWYMQLAYELA